MTTIRTQSSILDRFGLNGAAASDLSVYVEDKNGNRVNITKPKLTPGHLPHHTATTQNETLGSALDDLMRDMFGLPSDKKHADRKGRAGKGDTRLGDTKLEYTAPDGTKVKLDIDRPDKPKTQEAKTEEARTEEAKDHGPKKPQGCMGHSGAPPQAKAEPAPASSTGDTLSDSIDEAVTEMMKEMGFDTDDAKQSDFEQMIEASLESSLSQSAVDSLTDRMLDNVLSSMFGDYGTGGVNGSSDSSAFSPWSPWGNSLFSSYNPYLTARTFPASYAYAQMLGEWAIANQRPVYNANLKYQGGYSF